MRIESRKESVSDRLKKGEEHQDTVLEQEHQDIITVPTVKSVLSMPTNINPVETRLMTNEVELKPYKYMKLTEQQQLSVRQKNVHNFHKQITHNLSIGAKALYLVCRDLRQASVRLQADEFSVLKDTLPISDPTISKYITIAESEVCRQLYIKGRLPESWTTMYEIAKIQDEDMKDRVLKQVSVKTTNDSLQTMIGSFKETVSKVKNAFTSLFKFEDLDKPKDFIKVAVESNKEKGSIDPNALLMIKERVESAVALAITDYKKELINSDYKLDKSLVAEVVANETLIDKSKNSVLRYFKKYKQDKFKTRFLEKFNDLTGVQLTQSTK